MIFLKTHFSPSEILSLQICSILGWISKSDCCWSNISRPSKWGKLATFYRSVWWLERRGPNWENSRTMQRPMVKFGRVNCSKSLCTVFEDLHSQCHLRTCQQASNFDEIWQEEVSSEREVILQTPHIRSFETSCFELENPQGSDALSWGCICQSLLSSEQWEWFPVLKSFIHAEIFWTPATSPQLDRQSKRTLLFTRLSDTPLNSVSVERNAHLLAKRN